MARLALRYVSNFPSPTNQHAIVCPARSSLPTSTHSHSFSTRRGESTKVLVRFVLFGAPTICEGEKKLARSHFHVQFAIGHEISGNFEERNRNNDLVPTRRRCNDHEITWERHRRWDCVNPPPKTPPNPHPRKITQYIRLVLTH